MSLSRFMGAPVHASSLCRQAPDTPAVRNGELEPLPHSPIWPLERKGGWQEVCNFHC